MGLAATIANAVGVGFAALGDVAETVTYRHRSAASYSASAGVVTESFSDDTASAVIADYTRQERADTAIQPEDRKALVLASTLTAAPVLGDQLVTAAGQTLQVVGVETDPVSAVWVLQVRRPA